MRIYLSGPLFTEAERRWNRQLAAALEDRMTGAEVILPQDFTFDNSFNDPRDFPKIFETCLRTLREADVVVAVLDGPDVDSGTALELGVAYERGMPIIGVRTDYRESQERGVNLIVAQACTELLRSMSFAEDTTLLAKDLAAKIVAALRRAGKTG